MKNRFASGVALVLATGSVVVAVGMQRSRLTAEERRAVESVTKLTRSPRPPLANGGSEVVVYDEKGELKRPTGYETWVFVGSNLGLEYSDDVTKEKPVKKEERTGRKRR